MRQEESFGVIPLSKKKGIWSVFLIQHKHAHYWGFPKGHAEPRESAEQAALRELKEETNLDVVKFLQVDPIIEQYQFILEGKPISKRVHYFIAEVSGDVILQEEELKDGIWLSISDALNKVTHKEGKAILSSVEKILPNL